MANTLTALMDRILARVLIHQRKRVVFPRLVNGDFSTEMKKKGQTVDIKVPQKLAAYDIVPGATRTVGHEDTAPDTVGITLDNHKGNGFSLTDKETTQINASEDYIPMEIQEAANGLIDEINQSIPDKYKKIYGFCGTPGTTPFQRATTPTADHEDTFILSAAGGVLNEQQAPVDPRHFVMSIAAHTNAQRLDAFRHAEKLGDARVAQRAQLGMLGGFENWWQHYIPTHTAGTITTGLAAKAATAQAIGDKTIEATTAATTGACALVEGDVIAIAGHNQTYVLTAAATQASAASDVVLNVEPGLEFALSGGEAITVKGDHVVNLAFNPYAFALVMRSPQDFRPGGIVTDLPSRTFQDPVTGLVLRLEVIREHKQWYFELDALWGTECVFPWLATRAAG